ncbi:MAG: hypothetical protein ACR2PA_08930 [Hyphomicrobiaceae bacterium]
MQFLDKSRSVVAVLVLALWSVGIVVDTAEAGWLTRLLREAGETGGDIGRRGVGQLDDAAARLKRLPKGVRTGAIAATASAEGHWTFVNRSGQRFTAANPEEMSRLTAVLFPDGVGPNGLNIYLGRNEVFTQRISLGALPKNARLWIVSGKQAYRLKSVSVRQANGKSIPQLYAVIRRNLWVPVVRRDVFEEALWQLNRRLKPEAMRVIALVPDGPAAFATIRRSRSGAGDGLVDAIDPKRLFAALAGLRGQTAIVTGRIDGAKLAYRTATGLERSVDLAEVRRVASAHDVNLIILNARTPRQPGSRNWLWQRVGVDGLNDALRSNTMADFLARLTAEQGQLSLYFRSKAGERVAVSIVSNGSATLLPGSDTIGQVLAEIVSEVAGQVAATSLQLDLVGRQRQRELDRRIVPGVHSDIQFGILVFYFLGLFGLPVARNWWRGVWPPEARDEYGGWFGYSAARGARLIIFILLFLPVVGLPAAVWNVVLSIWRLLMLPWRIFRWLTGLAASHGTIGSGSR